MSDFLRDVDPSRYLRPPVADVAGTVALAIALLSATHRGFPAPVRRAAKVVRTEVLKLQEAWAEQQKMVRAPKVDSRGADTRSDRAWAAMAAILQALASLPDTLHEARVAARLHETLFPTGLRFLALPFGKQWAEGERRLRMIDDEELADELTALVGEVVMNEVREAHAEYGRVLGITRAAEEAAVPVNLLDALRATRSAMTAYALQVIAAGQADDALAGPARAALRPFDAVRDAQARRAAARARQAGTEPTEGLADGEEEPLDDAAPEEAPELDDVSPSTPIPEVEELLV